MKLNLLKDDQGNFSTQRISLIGALIGIMYLLFVVGIYILKRADTETGVGESGWYGMAAFVTGLLTGLGINAGVKAWQKKFEKKD